jgi:hypothetical protein
VSDAPRDAVTGRFVPARSAIQRREFALIAQKHPNPSTLAPAEREAVAAFLGIKADDLAAAHAYARQTAPQPQSGSGPTDSMSAIDRRALHLGNYPAPPYRGTAAAADELAGMSAIDRRALQLRLRQR